MKKLPPLMVSIENVSLELPPFIPQQCPPLSIFEMLWHPQLQKGIKPAKYNQRSLFFTLSHTATYLLELLRPPGLFEKKNFCWFDPQKKKIMKNGPRFAKPCCLTSAPRIYLNGALKFKGQFVADFHLVRLVFWQNRPPTNFCLIKLQLVL